MVARVFCQVENTGGPTEAGIQYKMTVNFSLFIDSLEKWKEIMYSLSTKMYILI
jgi:hypothetical protein